MSKYPKVFINRYEEPGGLEKIPKQAMDIQILKKVKEYPTKLSIEIKKPHIKGPEGETRSFRTEKITTIENIIRDLSTVLAYFQCEKGNFNNPFGEGIDTTGIDMKVNDALKHLIDKIKGSYWDGIREYFSD